MLQFNPLKDPCLSCGLWVGKRHPCIRPPEENLKPGGVVHGQIVLIGEAPGNEEDKSGTAFIGPAGKILREALDRLGVTDFAFLNAVSCRPTKGVSNRPPTTYELKFCQSFLCDNLTRLEPRLILCLGLIAAKSLGLHGKMRDLRNKEWSIDRHTWTAQVGTSPGDLGGEVLPTTPCFVTYHPAASMRPGQKHLAQVMEEDIKLYLGALKSDSRKALTNEAKCEIIPIEGGDEYLVVDIENDGFLKGKDPFPFGDKGREIWVIGTDRGDVDGYTSLPS